MKLCVQLFAAAKDLAGRSEVEIDVPSGASIGDVRRALVDSVPKLERITAHAMFAINAEYVSETAIVPEKCEIALIPPVSGG